MQNFIKKYWSKYWEELLLLTDKENESKPKLSWKDMSFDLKRMVLQSLKITNP